MCFKVDRRLGNVFLLIAGSSPTFWPWVMTGFGQRNLYDWIGVFDDCISHVAKFVRLDWSLR